MDFNNETRIIKIYSNIFKSLPSVDKDSFNEFRTFYTKYILDLCNQEVELATVNTLKDLISPKYTTPLSNQIFVVSFNNDYVLDSPINYINYLRALTAIPRYNNVDYCNSLVGSTQTRYNWYIPKYTSDSNT